MTIPNIIKLGITSLSTMTLIFITCGVLKLGIMALRMTILDITKLSITLLSFMTLIFISHSIMKLGAMSLCHYVTMALWNYGIMAL